MPGRRFALSVCLLVLGGLAGATARTPTTVTDLGTLGGGYSFAYGVNDHGEVVGDSELAAGDRARHAFLWRGGTMMIDLGALEGHSDSIAFDINNHGQVVGYSFD